MDVLMVIMLYIHAKTGIVLLAKRLGHAKQREHGQDQNLFVRNIVCIFPQKLTVPELYMDAFSIEVNQIKQHKV